MTKEIVAWADPFMFEAAPIDSAKGPEVFLLGANADPLGSIAHAALAYVGDFRENLSMITDDERRHYLGEIQKTALAMPLETVNFEFMFRGVTRGFTHQLVRQRTASYSQESTRFAVKSGVPVGLPPSLIGSDPEAWRKNWKEGFKQGLELRMGDDDNSARRLINQHADEYAYKYTSQKDRWRHKWDKTVKTIEESYNELVDDGMPAEDGRGLLPTNLLTQVNYNTSLRGLQDHAGLRLCTQAQREWKDVWIQIIQAIRKYGKTVSYAVIEDGSPRGKSSEWQFSELANIFRPVCFYTGKCEFGADFDRKCNIRSKVEAYRQNDVSSKEWETGRADLGIPPILPQEWTRADAAR